MQAAAAGDEVAWNHLVERFAGLLWAICRSYRLDDADAADACQLTWLRLLENLESIREPARLPGWLATTCRRECLAVLRRNRRLHPVNDDVLRLLATTGPAADHEVLVADRDARLWAAFQLLNHRCQQILRLLVVIPENGPPEYRSVAAALGLPAGSLGPGRARCLARLRQLLDAEGISGLVADS